MDIFGTSVFRKCRSFFHSDRILFLSAGAVAYNSHRRGEIQFDFVAYASIGGHSGTDPADGVGDSACRCCSGFRRDCAAGGWPFAQFCQYSCGEYWGNGLCCSCFHDCVEILGAVDKCICVKYTKFPGKVSKSPKRVDRPERKCYTPFM